MLRETFWNTESFHALVAYMKMRMNAELVPFTFWREKFFYFFVLTLLYEYVLSVDVIIFLILIILKLWKKSAYPIYIPKRKCFFNYQKVINYKISQSYKVLNNNENKTFTHPPHPFPAPCAKYFGRDFFRQSAIKEDIYAYTFVLIP